MQRTGVLIALLIALFWQSAVLARTGTTAPLLVDAEHAMLHWSDEGHHHHDDGSFHLDTSGESVQHLMFDLTNCNALLCDAPPALHSPSAGSPGRDAATAAPPPFLDGLLRPPSATA